MLAALALAAGALDKFCGFRTMHVGTATGPGAGRRHFGPQFAAIAAAGGASSGAFAGALGQHEHRVPQPAGQRVRFRARRSQAEPAWRRRLDPLALAAKSPTIQPRLRPATSTPAFSIRCLGTDANFNCAGTVKSTVRRRPGRAGHFPAQRRRLEPASRHHGRLSRPRARPTAAADQTNFEVPFFGLYAVATKGRFFADVMVRDEFYSADLTNPPVGLFGQQIGARGTVGLGLDRLQFRARQQLVHRAVGRLHLVADQRRQLQRQRRH